MSTTATSIHNDLLGSSATNVSQPVDPFRSLLVHFGMLLGVDDFETVDAYHRGKMWLHSAWLHREGAVWGLRVKVNQETGEIIVSKGLALDALGRELYLENDACLDIARWYEEHKDDEGFTDHVTEDEFTGTVTLDAAHVVIGFKGCLARQVPALSEPCEGSESTTAYSRVVETGELTLIPGKAPEWRKPPGSLPYHRLRLLFGLEEPIKTEAEGASAEDTVVTDDDQLVLDRRAAILRLGVEDQPDAYLQNFREFAAMDEMDLEPESGDESDAYALFPGRDPAAMPLAEITDITLQATQGGWRLDSEPIPEVKNYIRPVHVATSTIQELLCGPMCRCGAASEETGMPAAADAGGPRVDPDSVSLGEVGNARTAIRFNVVGGKLIKKSVASGIFVTSFDAKGGWQTEKIAVNYQHDSQENVGSVTITLTDSPTGKRLRLIVKGTGEFPLLGQNNIPLAGVVGGPPGGRYDGHDFIHMFTTGS